jgi:hypothetical protein
MKISVLKSQWIYTPKEIQFHTHTRNNTAAIAKHQWHGVNVIYDTDYYSLSLSFSSYLSLSAVLGI